MRLPTAALVAAAVAALTALSGELAKIGGPAARVGVVACVALLAFLGTLAQWRDKLPPGGPTSGGPGASG